MDSGKLVETLEQCHAATLKILEEQKLEEIQVLEMKNVTKEWLAEKLAIDPEEEKPNFKAKEFDSFASFEVLCCNVSFFVRK